MAGELVTRRHFFRRSLGVAALATLGAGSRAAEAASGEAVEASLAKRPGVRRHSKRCARHCAPRWTPGAMRHGLERLSSSGMTGERSSSRSR